ncbi:MAG: recombinase family protein [Mesorhizobium sp.]|uniref:recombinase family protein n=1 Tax=unclassified Mesorhizobium TaxID=325217 RepID=UPI000FD91454|nr:MULTISPECIES: recombinase family protein [unclassified Mesorhizobium]TGQ20039.1 recombinase family protein [Mesorhizobium sp. M00.F.Ca.ET.217.01.1.1]TGS69168.1 recombinase family protein [Mesorhizobium sp. M3A.F.Ca.ET.201.01.1.1]TGV94508.1 recombinase family protein [Mesorhizobium sp. M00.F.Ca.ET.158.01.1.1]TKB40048.1 MAG: recombinase family protein [Mesorhizobium sp.]
MKYVAYYRVSTKKQARSGLGLEAQQQMVRQFAGAHGELVGEFVEVESGRNDRRTELAKAINTAKKGGASLLIARLDRFSRRVSFISTMMEKGVRLVIVEMPNATDFQLHIFAALAQEERRLISMRTKAALAQAKLRGVVLGKNGASLAAVNRERAKAYASQIRDLLPPNWRSESYSQLARYLNDAGLRTINGNSFHPQSAKNLVMILCRGPVNS